MTIRYYLQRIWVLINLVLITKVIPYLKSTFRNPLTAHIFSLMIMSWTGKIFPDQITTVVAIYLGFLSQYFIIHIIGFIWIPMVFYSNLKYYRISDSRTLQIWKIAEISIFEVMIILSSFLAVSMSLMNNLFSIPSSLSTIVLVYGTMMMIFNFFIKNRLVSVMARSV